MHRLEICAMCGVDFRPMNRMFQLKISYDEADALVEEEMKSNEPSRSAPANVGARASGWEEEEEVSRTRLGRKAHLVIPKAWSVEAGCDPSRLPPWPWRAQRLLPAFSHQLSMQETWVAVHSRADPTTRHDLDLDVRDVLVQLAGYYDARAEEREMTPRFIIEDDTQNQAVMLDVVDIRTSGDGSPLLIVQYSYNVAANLNRNILKQLTDSLVVPRGASSRVMMKLVVTVGCIQALREILDLGTTNLAEGYVAPCLPLMPSYPPMFKASVLRPIPQNEHDLSINYCSNRSCKIVASLLCGRCKQNSYCSRDCQVIHFKSGGHKAVCRPFTTSCVVSMVTPIERAVGRDLVPLTPEQSRRADPEDRRAIGAQYLRDREARLRGLSVLERGNLEAAKSLALNMHGLDIFIVKVQRPTARVPGDTEDINCVYDEKRTFTMQVPLPDDVTDKVKAEPMWRGLKAYLYARREGSTLRIFTDACAPNQPW